VIQYSTSHTMRASCRRLITALTGFIILLQAIVLVAEHHRMHHSRTGRQPPSLPPSISAGKLEAGTLTNTSTPAVTTPSDRVGDEHLGLQQSVSQARRAPRVVTTLRGSTPFHSPAEHITRQKLPNILLMIADDAQPKDLGQGYTPSIDGIGAAGIRFANAHTPSPLCTPSRYTLLTGRHPSCHFHGAPLRANVTQIGVDGQSSSSPDLQPIEFNINLPHRANTSATSTRGSSDVESCSMPTSGAMLRQHGYSTGFVGKWHLGYPALSVSAAERERVIGSPLGAWKAVKGAVLAEYRSIQQHVRRCGFDYAERIYVNNLYPEQHVSMSLTQAADALP
jgi:hypothetical protein